MPGPLRIVLVDDHEMVRHGLKAMLAPFRSRIRVVGEADGVEDAIALVDGLDPDIVLSDVRLQGASGLDLCRRLCANGSGRRVVLLSVYDDEQYLYQALRAGAAGYLIKRITGDDLVRHLELVHDGETVIDPGMAGRAVASAARLHSGEFWPGARHGLTHRESEVLSLVVSGLSQPRDRGPAGGGGGDGQEPSQLRLPQARRQGPGRCRGGRAARGHLPVSGPSAPRRPALTGLADLEQENALLLAIVEAASSGPDVEPLAAAVARLIVEATATDVCFVHVLDDGGHSLTLVGATPPFDEEVGTVRLPIGTGVTGWVAEHRVPAVILDDKQADARYLPIPALRGHRLHLDGVGADDERPRRPGRRPQRAHGGPPRVHAARHPAAHHDRQPGGGRAALRLGCTAGWRPASAPRSSSPSR